MAIALGNREKIVIGSIITIFIIAGLHLFIYSAKARSYTETMNQLREAKDQYARIHNISPVKLEKYTADTKKYEDELNELIKTLKLDAPKMYYAPMDPVKIRDFRRNIINELMRLRKEAKISLSFLGEDGWDFPRDLPEEIVKKRVNLWDLISKLSSIQSIIEISKDSPTVLAQKTQEYEGLMRQIGIDVAKLKVIERRFGTEVPNLKLMAHAELILRDKPEEYKITIDELYKLLKIEINPATAFFVNRQLEHLLNLIDLAQKNNIDDIISVKLIEMKTVKEETQQQGGAPSAAPQRVVPRVPGMAAEEEALFGARDGGPPRAGRRDALGDVMGPEMLPGEGPAGPYGMYGIPQPVVQDTRKDLYNLVPIEIRYKASNLNSSRFLYDITHIPATYEIDNLAIRSIAEANVETIATINIVGRLVDILVSFD
ncbi:MAG: hypothetical protein N2246_03020 [Candidatus Sumerlaeia bacterium]|nr:hypothetical protein [Candidatus Sumerlaeia bacterium]